MAQPSETLTMEPGLTSAPREENVAAEHFPLSFAQQRLWMLDRLEPNCVAYNIPLTLRLTGSLDLPALQHSLTEILLRHEVLRTRFRAVDGEPSQIVFPAEPVRLAISDLTTVPDGERESRARELAGEEARRPFDLTKSPVIRASLLRLEADDHVLLLNAHHIAFDGWSVDILLNDLTAFYRSFVAGESAALPDLPVRYVDYAVWQRRLWQSEKFQERLSYWKQKLAAVPTGVELPTDRPRPSIQAFRGATHSVVLDKSLTNALRELSRHEGVILFMTLLATFNVLLSRYSSQDDIVVGTPIANRNHAAVEKLIGLFVNTLVLRNDLSGNPTFRELLQRVRMTAVEAYAQEVPFEKLVEELRPERDLSRNPLFQIMFALQNEPEETHSLPDLTVSRFPVESGTERFDLTVTLFEREDSLKATFGYNADLFDESTIARMMDHFRRLLEGIVANSEHRASELPLLGEDERHKVLVTFNDTAADFQGEFCVHQFFEAQAARTPDAVALVCGDERLSYRELNTRANRLAHYLQKRGVGPEVLVGICAERSVDMLVGILGILKSGGAYVPLDPAYPKERLGYTLEDAKAPVLLTQQPLVEALPENTAEVIRLDADWAAIARESSENTTTSTRPENLAYVLFTSGSTGRPKGVALEHHSAATFIHWAQTVFTPEELSGTLFSTSMCFDLSVFEMFVPLSVGGKIILASNALFLPSLPAASEVTLINTVPSAIAELVHMSGVPESVRVVNLAGEALPTPLVHEIYEKTKVQKVYNLYGPTEDTTYSTYTLVKRGEEVTIGRPVANTQAYILDPQRQPVPIGVPGELYLAGDGLARGYYGRTDLTSGRFFSNPFSTRPNARMYCTGDLCRFLPDGTIQYLGRIDNQVKIRGFRIELGEIESLLSRHPAVHSCAVTARENKPGDKRLVAYVVFAPGQEVSNNDLRAFLKESLPEYMVPGIFVPLDALPLTPNGKVNRRALPAADLSQLGTSNIVAARDSLEQMLVNIWKRVLGISKIGVRDNFFDLGGHSLLAARLLSEVETITGHGVPLSALFRGATVEGLAQLIREGSASSPDPLVMEIQAGNGGLPFFAVASPAVDTLGYALLARHMGPEQPFYKLQAHAPVVNDRPFTKEDLRTLVKEYIAAMRAVQPEGPYCFGGMCEGVQIAEQMVLELEAQGEEVGFLVILDTWVLENSQVPWLWRLHYYRERLRSLRRMRLSDQMLVWKRALRNNVRHIAQPGKPEVRSDWREAYWPCKNFQPPRFRAPVVLFKRSKQPFYYINDPQMGWGARSQGGVETRIIDFHHLEMLREPYVRIVGETLAARMQRLRQERPASLCQPDFPTDDSAAATSGRMA